MRTSRALGGVDIKGRDGQGRARRRRSRRRSSSSCGRIRTWYEGVEAPPAAAAASSTGTGLIVQPNQRSEWVLAYSSEVNKYFAPRVRFGLLGGLVNSRVPHPRSLVLPRMPTGLQTVTKRQIHTPKFCTPKSIGNYGKINWYLWSKWSCSAVFYIDTGHGVTSGIPTTQLYCATGQLFL